METKRMDMKETSYFPKAKEQQPPSMATVQYDDSGGTTNESSPSEVRAVDEESNIADSQMANLNLNEKKQTQNVEEQQLQKHRQVAGPLHKQRNEFLFPHIAETHIKCRAAIAGVCDGTFQQHMMKTINQYLAGYRSEYDKAMESPFKCRKLARSISRTLDLLRSLCTCFSDLYDYQYRLSEMVAIYISCELSYAKEFKEPKPLISNRICNVIFKHIHSPNEATTRNNILRMFVFMPKMYKEREVMTNIFKKFVPMKSAQQELPDRLYIQYLIIFYQWKQLEIDLEEQMRVIDHANSFMRPAKSLCSNPTYAYHLPKYESRRNATKCILQNLKFFQDLRNASLYDNCLKNSSTIIDLSDDDDPSDSCKYLNFSKIVDETQIEPVRKPSKFEKETVIEFVDLTTDKDDEDVNTDDDLDWLQNLRLSSEKIVSGHTLKDIVNSRISDDVIEIDSDSESKETNDTINTEPELFSLDFEEPECINPQNICDENMFNSFDDDSNDTFETSRFQSNLRTYTVNKDKHTISVIVDDTSETINIGSETFDNANNDTSELPNNNNISNDVEGTPQLEQSELNNVETSDLNNVEASDLNNVETSDLNNVERSESNNVETSESNNDETNELNNVETNELNNGETRELNNTETSDLNNTETSELNNTESNELNNSAISDLTEHIDTDLNDDFIMPRITGSYSCRQGFNFDKVIYSQPLQCKSVHNGFFPETESIKESSNVSGRKDDKPAKKHVKFNENPMGPSPRVNANKMPIKPAISNKYKNPQPIFTTGPFSCASPAASTSSNSSSSEFIKQTIRKGMIEEYILIDDSDDDNNDDNCDNGNIVKFSTHPTKITKESPINNITKNDLSVFNASIDITSENCIQDDNNIEDTKDISSTNCNEIKTMQANITLSNTDELMCNSDNSNLSNNAVFDSSKCENKLGISNHIVAQNDITSLHDVSARSSMIVSDIRKTNDIIDNNIRNVNFISEVSSTVGDITTEDQSESKGTLVDDTIDKSTDTDHLNSRENSCNDTLVKTLSNECESNLTPNVVSFCVGKCTKSVDDSVNEVIIAVEEEKDDCTSSYQRSEPEIETSIVSNISGLILNTCLLDSQEPSSTVGDNCYKENMSVVDTTKIDEYENELNSLKCPITEKETVENVIEMNIENNDKVYVFRETDRDQVKEVSDDVPNLDGTKINDINEDVQRTVATRVNEINKGIPGTVDSKPKEIKEYIQKTVDAKAKELKEDIQRTVATKPKERNEDIPKTVDAKPSEINEDIQITIDAKPKEINDDIRGAVVAKPSEIYENIPRSIDAKPKEINEDIQGTVNAKSNEINEDIQRTVDAKPKEIIEDIQTTVNANENIPRTVSVKEIDVHDELNHTIQEEKGEDAIVLNDTDNHKYEISHDEVENTCELDNNENKLGDIVEDKDKLKFSIDESVCTKTTNDIEMRTQKSEDVCANNVESSDNQKKELELNKTDQTDTLSTATTNSISSLSPIPTFDSDKINVFENIRKSSNDDCKSKNVNQHNKDSIDTSVNDAPSYNYIDNDINKSKLNKSDENYEQPLWIITQNTAMHKSTSTPINENSNEDRSIKIKLSKSSIQVSNNGDTNTTNTSKELLSSHETEKKCDEDKNSLKGKTNKDNCGIGFEKIEECKIEADIKKNEKSLNLDNMDISNDFSTIGNMQNMISTKEKNTKLMDLKNSTNASSDIDSDIEFDFDFVFGFDFDSIGNNSTEANQVETTTNSSIAKEFEADKLLEEFNNTTEVIVENCLGKSKEQSYTDSTISIKRKHDENTSKTMITAACTSALTYTPLSSSITTVSESLGNKNLSIAKVEVEEKAQTTMPLELANDLIDLNEELLPASDLIHGASLLTDFTAAITPIETEIKRNSQQTVNTQVPPLDNVQSVKLTLNHDLVDNELKFNTNSIMKPFNIRSGKNTLPVKTEDLWNTPNILSFDTSTTNRSEVIFSQSSENFVNKATNENTTLKGAKPKVVKQTIEQEFSKVQTQMEQLGISATISLDPKTPSLIVSIPTNSIKNLKETLYKCGNTLDTNMDGPSTSASVLSALSKHTNPQLYSSKMATNENEETTYKNATSNMKNFKDKTITYNVLEDNALQMSRQVLFRGIANYSPDPENLQLDITLPLKKRRKLSEFQDDDVLTYAAPITEEDDNSNSMVSDAESIKRSLNENTTFFMQLVAKKLNTILMQGKQDCAESVRAEPTVPNTKKNEELFESKGDDAMKLFSNDKSMQPISQKEIVTCEADSSGSVVTVANNMTWTDSMPQTNVNPLGDYIRNRPSKNRLQPQVNLVAPQLKNANTDNVNCQEHIVKRPTMHSTLPVSYPATPMFSVANFEKLVRLQRYIDMLMACVDVTELIASASLPGISVDIHVYEEARAVILEQATIISAEGNGSSKPLLLKQHTDGSISILNDNDDGNEWLVLPASTAKQLQKVSTALTLLQEQQHLPMHEFENPVRTRIELALNKLIQKSKNSNLSSTAEATYEDKHLSNLLNSKGENIDSINKAFNLNAKKTNTTFQCASGQDTFGSRKSSLSLQNLLKTNAMHKDDHSDSSLTMQNAELSSDSQLFTRTVPHNAQTMLVFNENTSNIVAPPYDMYGLQKCSDHMATRSNVTNSTVMSLPPLLPPLKYKDINRFDGCHPLLNVSKNKSNMYEYNANNYNKIVGNYLNNMSTINDEVPTNLAFAKQQTIEATSLSEQQKYNKHFHSYQTPLTQQFHKMPSLHSINPPPYQSTNMANVPNQTNSFKTPVDSAECLNILQRKNQYHEIPVNHKFYNAICNYTNQMQTNKDLSYTITHNDQILSEQQSVQLLPAHTQNANANQKTGSEMYQSNVPDLNFIPVEKSVNMPQNYYQKGMQIINRNISDHAHTPQPSLTQTTVNTLSSAPRKRGRPRKYNVINEKKPKSEVISMMNCITPVLSAINTHRFNSPSFTSKSMFVPNINLNNNHMQTYIPTTEQQLPQLQQQPHQTHYTIKTTVPNNNIPMDVDKKQINETANVSNSNNFA